jgi:PKD repeat protein
MKGGFFYSIKIILVLAIVCTGFFCMSKAYASQSILISEIQITGGAGKTENDFIELYNPNNFPINLKGYRLVKRTKTGTTDTSIKSWSSDAFIPANSYYLWANGNYTDISVTPNTTTTATISDDNGIAIRLGAADTGTIIDSLAWGEAQNIFIEGSVFPNNPGANQSLGRKFNLDTGDNSLDFVIQDQADPQNAGEVITPPPLESTNPGGETNSTPESTPNQTGTETFDSSSDTPLIKNNLGDVVINEIVSDPTDNENEWVELINRTSREIDLTGWWLEEGSKAKTKLNGIIGINGSNRLNIVDKPAGNLNNAGDVVVLYDLSGKLIDQVAYGNWADGDLSDNAQVAGDPNSLARKFDGHNTYDNLNDFAVTRKPTKGTNNIIEIEDEVNAQAKANFDFSNNIFISEFLPNPDGDDTKLEFIEIYNTSKRAVDLTGWSLSNQDNKKVSLEKIATSTVIQASGFLVVYRLNSKLALRNDDGQVKLFEPLAEEPRQTVEYEKVKEGYSYNSADYKINGEWLWSETLTPGAKNIFKAINHAPEVEFSFSREAITGQPIIFDSSDTADQDGDKLTYAWNFGDGIKNNLPNPEHTYFNSGIYSVKLEVSDGQASSTKEKSLKIFSSLDTLNADKEMALVNAGPSNSVIINEVFPDPKGSDQGQEWLEIKNQSADKINFLNWRLENSNGKYKFKNDLWLDGESFYLLTGVESNLAFKNTTDIINLYNNLDELLDKVEYTDAVQGESYARGQNGKWFWTTKITPDEENLISLADSQSVAGVKISNLAAGAGNYIETTLEQIKELAIDDLVKVKGTVAVEPGILGTQIFYIVGSPGLQVYNYKKDFPILKVGDYVEVAGELAQTQGEFRIKTKDKSDIKIVEHKSPPVALAMANDQINEENIGQLITVTGEITAKKSNSLYVDDGSDEIYVYIKTSSGVSIKNFSTGQNISVTGILSKTQTGLRLLPRAKEDITQIDAGGELTPQVLGEIVDADEWKVAERDKKLELLKYLLIIAAGIIIVLAGLFIKTRKKI